MGLFTHTFPRAGWLLFFAPAPSERSGWEGRAAEASLGSQEPSHTYSLICIGLTSHAAFCAQTLDRTPRIRPQLSQWIWEEGEEGAASRGTLP